MSEFARVSTIQAVRKRHKCDGCPGHIDLGQPAWRWAGKFEGSFGTAIYHVECREAEHALNHLHETAWDEWMLLSDIESDDHPWLLEAFPDIAARYKITAESIREDEEERERCRRAFAKPTQGAPS